VVISILKVFHRICSTFLLLFRRPIRHTPTFIIEPFIIKIVIFLFCPPNTCTILLRPRISISNRIRLEGGAVKGIVEERAVELGEYIIQNKATVRSTAKKFGVSKSTVHKDVAQRLKTIDPQLHKKVKIILEYNKSQRHIRGGIATRLKYKKLM
jgi:putative DeoR family transcriptional regulator, stage III sporulation protein D